MGFAVLRVGFRALKKLLEKTYKATDTSRPERLQPMEKVRERESGFSESTTRVRIRTGLPVAAHQGIQGSSEFTLEPLTFRRLGCRVCEG